MAEKGTTPLKNKILPLQYVFFEASGKLEIFSLKGAVKLGL